VSVDCSTFCDCQMRWKQFWVYKSVGGLLTMCAVVVAWEVSCFVILGAVALLVGRLPFLVYTTGVVLMASPIVYAGVAIAAFVRGNRRGRRR
jgi:hypothetical protein